MRDLELAMTDNSHRCCALWALFDDRSEVGRTSLRKLEEVVRIHLGTAGIPVHDHIIHEGEPVDGPQLW